MPIVSLHVPGDIAYRDLTARTIASVCKMACNEQGEIGTARASDLVNEMVSAVGEAFNNIAIHGYGEKGSGTVVVTIRFDSKHIRVELSDNGKTFDPSSVADPDLDALPESGMGMYIIRSFVDEVEYAPGPPNVLSLTKYLKVG